MSAYFMSFKVSHSSANLSLAVKQ